MTSSGPDPRYFATVAGLTAEELGAFKRNCPDWAHFEGCPPGG